MSQVLQESQRFLDTGRTSALSCSFYDMAWVLRARIVEGAEQSRLLQRLISGQKSDGSWGGQIPHVHDRVLNTLSVVVALAELGIEPEATRRGIEYLQRDIPRLVEETVETIGFELVFPTLLETAQGLKLELPYEDKSVQEVSKLSREKKRLIPKALFAKRTPILHTLEAFSGFGDIPLFPDGSIGTSPAATAAYVMQRGPKEGCLQYIRKFSSNGWCIPPVFPITVFENAWALYNFLHAGLFHQLKWRPVTDSLWRHLEMYQGASHTDEFPMIDGDDTAMAYIVLREAGYPVPTRILEQFEEEGWFRCMELERNPSLSANIHILDAVRRTPDYPRRAEAIDKILRFLKQRVREDGSWLDKWHISPFYCTGHAVLAISELDETLCRRAVEYLLKTQREDGGWGIVASTREETAYALQALSHVSGGTAFLREIEAGRRFMRESPPVYPELWVGKVLYAPLGVLESAALVWRADSFQ